MKKNIVITGAGSFIARHLISQLDREKYNIIAAVRKCTKEQRLSEEVKYIELDMEEYHHLDRYVKQCDYYLPFSWNGTQREYRNNDNINRNSYLCILNSIYCMVEKAGCSKVILPGTLLEYKNYYKPIDENTPCDSELAYGKYKYELYKEAYSLCRKADVSLIETRLFSVYGYDDSDEKMINSVMQKMLKNEQILMTKAEQIWEFIHVDDVAAAFIKLMETDVESGCYNLTTSEHRTLRSYIEEMKQISGSKSEVRFGAIPYATQDIPHVICKTDKILNAIDWAPKISFCDGIKEMMQYYASV